MARRYRARMAPADDRILVVGGLSGIGAGIVAELGDHCLTWSRRTGVDATDEASVQRAATAVAREHGPPFGLIHCVGDFEETPLLETDSDRYHHLLDNNLTSAFLVVRHVVPAMVAARRGRVIFFAAAGVDDQTAKTRAPVYFAAKAALVSLARSLAKEVAPAGVTVNVISPGIIRHETSHHDSQDRMAPKVPAGRSGTVADVVGVVRLLLSAEGSYITGSNLTVDGGLSL
ncbi:MAG: SDR family NAD(P)-dependent oxidoreductase [Planctomycetota bacterium]